MAAYQVLARKYRPQQFSEMVGQAHIVRTLENAVRQKRIAHAYLFVGPRGTGKTTLARIFAKALNCSASKDPVLKPCDQCSNCNEIVAGNSMDVLEIDGASNNGVEQVRELRETVRYAPAGARFKIIYIDEVHMLSVQAFNALLKTLEEPPPYVKFFFATTDPQKIPLTILSRCQRFDLQRIPNDLIIQQLGKIAQLEKVEISDAALLAIARGALGGLRDAESALDQIIAFCGNKVEEQDVLSIFGLAARDQVRQLTGGIISGDRAVVIDLASALAAEGKDLGRLLGELTDHFRNVLMIQAGAKITEATAEEMGDLQTHARQLNRARSLRILEVLTGAEGQMKWALSKKIMFEVALLKAIETGDEMLLEEILTKLKGIYQGQPSETANAESLRENRAVPQAEAPRIAIAAPPNPVAPAPKGPTPDPSLEALWVQLKEEAQKKSEPGLPGALVEGRPLSVDANTLVIGFDREFASHKEIVDTPRSRKWLQAKLRELMHKAMNVKIVFADDPSLDSMDEGAAVSGAERSTADPSQSPAQVPSTAAPANQRFEDDPMIQKALEIFKGEIVNIKR